MGGGESCCRQKGLSRECTCQVSGLFYSQVPVMNELTNQRHAGSPGDSNSTEKLSDEKVIMIGRATLNDETDVRIAFHVIQRATASFSLIRTVSSDTGLSLTLICPSFAPP